jgi:hypothetical protein
MISTYLLASASLDFFKQGKKGISSHSWLMKVCMIVVYQYKNMAHAFSLQNILKQGDALLPYVEY